jgi:hypothetical protein
LVLVRGLNSCREAAALSAEYFLGTLPRYHLCFTRALATWFNMVECVSAEIADKGIRLCTLKRVADLENVIVVYLANNSSPPLPLICTAVEAKTLGKSPLQNQ